MGAQPKEGLYSVSGVDNFRDNVNNLDKHFTETGKRNRRKFR